LNATSGSKLWSYPTGSQIESSPVVANGVVYFGSDDNNVYALNAQTGATVWTFGTGGLVDSSPTIANDVVYVGSNDDKVYAFGAVTVSQPSPPPAPEFPSQTLVYSLATLAACTTFAAVIAKKKTNSRKIVQG